MHPLLPHTCTRGNLLLCSSAEANEVFIKHAINTTYRNTHKKANLLFVKLSYVCLSAKKMYKFFGDLAQTRIKKLKNNKKNVVLFVNQKVLGLLPPSPTCYEPKSHVLEQQWRGCIASWWGDFPVSENPVEDVIRPFWQVDLSVLMWLCCWQIYLERKQVALATVHYDFKSDTVTEDGLPFR